MGAVKELREAQEKITEVVGSLEIGGFYLQGVMTMCNQGQTDFGSQKNVRAVDQVEVPHSILDKLKTRWQCRGPEKGCHSYPILKIQKHLMIIFK